MKTHFNLCRSGTKIPPEKHWNPPKWPKQAKTHQYLRRYESTQFLYRSRHRQEKFRPYRLVRYGIDILGSNKQIGPIPFGLVNLTQLNILVLNNSRLIGSIPFGLMNLKNLYLLDISGNYLSGNVSICNTSLHIVDVSNNSFGGSLTQCLHIVFKGSELRAIRLSENKLQGLLPRSLVNCMMLEAIDVSNNQFNDTFPSWLGNLPHLKVLLLRSNKFHCQTFENSETNYEFPNMQILDLS